MSHGETNAMTRFSALTCLSPLAFIALSIVEHASAFAPPSKSPIPVEAELEKASERLKEAYKGDVAKAKSANERTALAQRYLEDGEEARQDPAARYVLLTMARDTAA